MATATRTTADKIAAALGNDGTMWHTTDGLSLDELAGALSGELEQHPTKPDTCRWIFPDGSVITVAGEAWDLGFATCWCWQGAPGDQHPAPSGDCYADFRDA